MTHHSLPSDFCAFEDAAVSTLIRSNNQVEDEYKARIDKGKKCQMNLKGALKGSTLTAGALYRCGVAVLGKDKWEYKKEKQR